MSTSNSNPSTPLIVSSSEWASLDSSNSLTRNSQSLSTDTVSPKDSSCLFLPSEMYQGLFVKSHQLQITLLNQTPQSIAFLLSFLPSTPRPSFSCIIKKRHFASKSVNGAMLSAKLTFRLQEAATRRRLHLAHVSRTLSLKWAIMAERRSRLQLIEETSRKRKGILLSMQLHSAYLARQMLLQKRVLRNGADVEYAQQVALLCRLRKSQESQRNQKTIEMVSLSSNIQEEGAIQKLEELCQVSPPSIPSYIRSRESVAIRMTMPINRNTLKELDFKTFATSVQIRHNLLFEPDMKFQPNNEGELGQHKLEKSNSYWAQVEKELQGYTNDEGKQLQPNFAIIPVIVTEVRDILMELLSCSKQIGNDLSENLDTKMLIQRLKHGVPLDVPKLVQYIGSTMLQHCAPCRDDVIKEWIKQHTLSSISGTPDFVTMFRTCFEILEIMKLDLANHQLREFRPHVVDTAIDFEWNHFFNMLKNDYFTLDKIIAWMRKAIETFPTTFKETKATPEAVYHHGYLQFLQNCTTIESEQVPEIFSLDFSRLNRIRNNWEDLNLLSCVNLLLQQFLGPQKCTPEVLQECSAMFFVIVQDNDFNKLNLSSQIIHFVEKYRKQKLTPAEATTIKNVIESSLSHSSSLYKLVDAKISCLLWQSLQNKNAQFVQEDLTRFGLVPYMTQLTELASIINRLSSHNKNVYKKVLNLIYSNLSP